MSSMYPAERLNVQLVQNQMLSTQGPKTCPLLLDFTATDSIFLDVSTVIREGFIDMIQTIFVDAKNLGSEMVISIDASGQDIYIQPRTQGYYPVLIPNPARLSFNCSSVGNGVVKAQMINVPIAGVVWQTS